MTKTAECSPFHCIHWFDKPTRVTTYELSSNLSTGKRNVLAVKEELGYYKVSARLVSRMLIHSSKGAGKARTSGPPHRSDTGSGASCRTVSRRMKSGKTHFEPETERQSMEWRQGSRKARVCSQYKKSLLWASGKGTALFM